MSVCMSMCLCGRMSVCLSVCLHVCMQHVQHVNNMYECMHVFVCECLCLCVHVSTYAFLYLPVNTNIYSTSITYMLCHISTFNHPLSTGFFCSENVSLKNSGCLAVSNFPAEESSFFQAHQAQSSCRMEAIQAQLLDPQNPTHPISIVMLSSTISVHPINLRNTCRYTWNL